MKVVGLDLSLTSTGVAVINDGDIALRRIRSKGTKTATLAERRDRLARIADEVPMLDIDLVVIEGPSYGQHRQGGQHDRAGLWWLLVDMYLTAINDPETGEPTRVAEVPPAVRSKYATGKGNAPKDHVLASVVRRYPDVTVDGNDTADALVLAAMGARALGQPIETSLPAAHLAAMDAVAWPDLAEATP